MICLLGEQITVLANFVSIKSGNGSDTKLEKQKGETKRKMAKVADLWTTEAVAQDLT